jgi:3-oxoacyl-[acyl-carrier-protein] synthase-3
LQDQLGANHAWGFDISAACSGFVYALTVGAQFISAGTHRKVLVVGADVMSAIVDYTDRTTCILFGDGAGAALLEPAEGEAGIFDFAHEADGSGATWISMVAGGSARPASHATVDQRLHFIRQDGQRVFKYAVAKMADKPKGLLQRNGLSTDDVDHLIAHQANGRILQAIGERMGLPPQKVIKNIERCGNTTAATIPLAMCSALDEGRFKDGDLIVLTSVGAGLTVGSMLMRWAAIPW